MSQKTDSKLPKLIPYSKLPKPEPPWLLIIKITVLKFSFIMLGEYYFHRKFFPDFLPFIPWRLIIVLISSCLTFGILVSLELLKSKIR